MSLPLLILAAGFGTRMGALTRDRPKALIEVAGMPLIDHALGQARAAGAGPIAVNAHHHAELLQDHLRPQTDLIILHETPKILDSGGAVKNARTRLGDGAMATMNADNAWSGPNPVQVLLDHWRGLPDEAQEAAWLLLVPRERAIGRQGGGDFAMAKDGRLTPDPTGHVYTGLQILAPGLGATHAKDVFSMWEIWQQCLDEGRLYGLIYPGHWADVGHPEGIALAEAMLAEQGHV